MKILIAGDSNAMPREGVPFEQTWVGRLVLDGRYVVIDKSLRASNTHRLISEGVDERSGVRGVDLLENYAPDLVVTQLGIVDCAPRLFDKKSVVFKCIRRLPKKAQEIAYHWQRRHGGRRLDCADVKVAEFRKNLEMYYQRAKYLGVYVISFLIFPATEAFRAKSPDIDKAIMLYNNVYFELSKLHHNVQLLQPLEIEVSGRASEEFYVDELHLNPKGHEACYTKLVRIIQGSPY
jgi:acyl-CoA thioesterase I